MTSISIILPTLNERENITALISKIFSVTHTAEFATEIIIVDGMSRDGTVETINKLYPNNSRVRVIQRHGKRELATAILLGIKKSTGDIIVGMDADFNHPPNKIMTLIRKLHGADLVIGSRFIKGGGMKDSWRQNPTYLFNLFLKYILGFPTMDNMSGFYAIRRLDLLSLPLDSIYRGYGEYHLRLVFSCQKRNMKITEIPVQYGKRRYGKSKSNLGKMVVTYFLTSLMLRFGKD